MQTGQKQIALISSAKNYLAKIESLKIDVAKSAFCWLLNIPGVPGYFSLKNLQTKKKINISSFFFNFFRFFMSTAYLHNFRILNNTNSEKNFETLIISWGNKNDFESNGSYNDRYFKINSRKNLKIMWFLLYSEDLLPKNIDKNIVLFGKENLKKKYNFFYFIKVFFTNIKVSNFSLTKFFHIFSRSSHFAELVSKEVLQIVKLKNFENILLPYESQPFQNTIFKEVKKENDKIKLIGYLHATQPLPTLHLYRDGAPDLLLVHGSSQIFHLEKYLNWPSNKLRLIPSIRYTKKNKVNYDCNLVLPYSLSSENILIKEFKNFLNKKEKGSLKPFIIRNHPFMNQSRVHKKFVKNIEKIILEYKDRFSDKAEKKTSIFFGGTSAILEALERGIQVVHIFADPVLESYSESLWPSIKVEKIRENVLEYNLSCYGKCISFSDEENILEKYCSL